MAAGRLISPTASSAVSTSSEEPDEDLRRAHNRLSLLLEKDITADQLRELKQYFYKAPLDAKIYGKIESFIELWNALDSYRTIKPGKYTHLKSALSTIGAKTCLASIKKFEIKEFKSRGAISRESAKQRDYGALLQESADLRKQVEREKYLKDEAEKERDLAVREREASHIRHEGAIREAWQEVEKMTQRDDDHQPAKVADNQGAWRVAGPEQGMEAHDDVDVIRFDQSQQNQDLSHILKDLLLTEIEPSHVHHEKAFIDAMEFEQEQRTRAERELEDLKKVPEENVKNSAHQRTTVKRMNSNGTPRHQENLRGFGEISGSDVSEGTEGYRTGRRVEVKSRSRSESDGRGITRGNRATWRQRFVATSWDETMSDRRPAVPDLGTMTTNTGEGQLYQQRERVCKELIDRGFEQVEGDGGKPYGFNEQREGDGEWAWLQETSCNETDNLFTNNTSNGMHDLDLGDILDSVLRCIDTEDLQQVTEIMDRLDADARKAVMSLKISHQTAVFKACVKGHVEFVEYFLNECGAATEEIGEYISEGGVCYQATPLWWASYTNQQKMVQTLISHGADVNAELIAIDSTPVLSACAMGNVEIVKYLAAHGANLQKPNTSGETCLHKSIQSLDLCLFLLNHGADINRVDGFGRTPLHHAVDAGPVEVVRLLARRGADVKVRDCCGDTVLEIAWRKGREKVAELLLKVMELNRVSGRGART